MSLHPALPQTKTKNDLGVWIKEHSEEARQHEEKVQYTEEELAEWKHKSAIASIEIEKLDALKKQFTNTLKKGTFCSDPQNGIYEPAHITIPGTKGLEILEANRSHASLQITNGYHTEITQLYGIPYAPSKKICFFDVEGNHWEQYDFLMNPYQMEKFGSPLFNTDITVSSGGKTVTMSGEEFLERTEKASKKKKEDKDDLPFDVD